jgi:excinuclease ABC subunit C
MNATRGWFPRTETIPTEPGVYRWFDSQDRILYVGKAKNLRSRLTSYFAKPETLHERTRRMVSTAVRIDWTIVKTEFEALQLEFTWIKQFNPPFNVQFRDDKSYPFLAVSFSEEFPRVFSTRNRRTGGDKYFGPYTQAWAIRETIDGLLKVFPVRSCGKSTFDNAARTGRPCLLAEIGKCSAPCVGRISKDDHRELATKFSSFVSGADTGFIQSLRVKMQEASENQQYELAAKFRDQLGALETVSAKSAVVFEDNTSADVFAVAKDDYSAAVNMFKVRDGRIRGARGWVLDLELERSTSEIIEFTLHNSYTDETDDLPKEVLVQELPLDHNSVEAWLSELKGSKVQVRVAQRGDKRSLLETAQTNAEHSLRNYKLKRSSDFTARSQALSNLQDALGLDNPPLEIECFDVSHLAGTGVVASKVVFVDGRPKKDLYRRYSMASATDDTDAMNQVLDRRFRAMADDDSRPDLIVVDGAKPQVNAAVRAAEAHGIVDVAIVGIAKRLEELWTAEDQFPVILPRASSELYLVQHLRDEAHRFAIGHQRLKRKASISTQLEEIPGLGPNRVRVLLRHFGSATRIRNATVEELGDIPGIGLSLALTINEALKK